MRSLWTRAARLDVASPFRRGLAHAAIAVASVVATTTPSAAFDCKAALVLAMDMSKSVDRTERALQANGLAVALTSPDVMAAILTPPGSGIMASAFLWGAGFEQELIADWTRLDSEAAIQNFAATVAGRGVFGRGRATAVGEALRYSAYLHNRNPVPCDRQVVDVSGDGAGNNGRPPTFFRDAGALDGLEINGLVILGASKNPLDYYLDRVIQGPGAFVIDIYRYGDYAAAMERKLLRELSPAAVFDLRETDGPG